MLDDFFWSAFNSGIGIGDTTDNVYSFENISDYSETIVDNEIYSFFDTGLTHILISNLYYDTLIEKIFDYIQGKIEHTIMQGHVVINCNDKARFPSLFFLINNLSDGRYWVELDA